MWWIIGLFCIGVSFIVLGIFLSKAAAPRNERERLIDDYQQMKALGYFKNTKEQMNVIEYLEIATSGCPVENNK